MSSIDPGLAPPNSWLVTSALVLAWLAVMWAYSRVAARLATLLFRKPPDLSAFCALQQSRGKLAVGIDVPWLLGGFLEELILRGTPCCKPSKLPRRIGILPYLRQRLASQQPPLQPGPSISIRACARPSLSPSSPCFSACYLSLAVTICGR